MSNEIIHSSEHNGYTYDVYSSGTTVARGEIQDASAARNSAVQRSAGGESRLADDHGGHLVPASQNGTADSINIFAQNSKVNTRDVRAAERAETEAVRNGASIQTERIAFCSSDANRPDAFMINDSVTVNGSTQNIHSSFTNTDMSVYENEFSGLANAPDSYAAAENSGLGRAEYESLLDGAESLNISDYDGEWTDTCGMSDFGEGGAAESSGNENGNDDGDSMGM